MFSHVQIPLRYNALFTILGWLSYLQDTAVPKRCFSYQSGLWQVCSRTKKTHIRIGFLSILFKGRVFHPFDEVDGFSVHLKHTFWGWLIRQLGQICHPKSQTINKNGCLVAGWLLGFSWYFSDFTCVYLACTFFLSLYHGFSATKMFTLIHAILGNGALRVKWCLTECGS